MRVKNFLQSIILISTIIVGFSSCFHEDNKINATCFDEVLNQDEEFIDCGGPNCDECPPACDNGIFDDVEGWQEWGVDCGGPCPSCCDNGIWDHMNPDETKNEEWIDCGGLDPLCEPCESCANGIHDPGEVFVDPTTGLEVEAIDCDNDPTTECPPCNELCNDGLYNGIETLCADCGGVCPACDVSQCTNEMIDEYDPEATTSVQSESGIDCGGCLCIPCDDLSLCSDGYISGFEEAIDCGGPYCIPCLDPSLCTDGILNGYETEVDCYDGTEIDESSCPPCDATCANFQYDGFETDTDCGGEFCPPCFSDAEDAETNWLNYTVAIEGDPTTKLYESKFNTVDGFFVEGEVPTAMDPGVPDSVTFGGGEAHQLVFFLKDDDLAPLNWSLQGDPIVLNFLAPLAASGNNVILMADNGVQYESRVNGTGITITNLDVEVQGISATEFEITFIGDFAGTLEAADGTEAYITNGDFRVQWIYE